MPPNSKMANENRNVDWSTYDRISPTNIPIEKGNAVPFRGIIIGHRKYLGLIDYVGMPLFVALLVALIPAYANFLFRGACSGVIPLFLPLPVEGP